jgi:CRP-like cAMP-binding protein
MSEKYWYLKRCDLFERLTPEQLARVESRSRLRKFPRKNPIYLPADQADGVLLLAAGRVKLCNFTTDGKQSILTFIEPGEIFGELALFEGGPREEYAEAVLAATVLLIPSDEMQRILQEHADVSLGVTKLIGLRRRRIERRLKYLLFHSNRDRLIHLLLELAEQYAVHTTAGLDLGIKLSHQDLANIIGATRETVTVILGELQSEGLLTVGRRKITLVNVEELARNVQISPPHIETQQPASKQNQPIAGRAARSFS